MRNKGIFGDYCRKGKAAEGRKEEILSIFANVSKIARVPPDDLHPVDTMKAGTERTTEHPHCTLISKIY